LSVQDFEDYGRRDYQRPFRDLKMGMLPPKVAQIMINMANLKKGEHMLDPFCGGGTILQEALLMDINAVGSDIDVNAIRGAESNLAWFRNRYNIPFGRYQILKLDAASELTREFKPDNFDAIVTEGWLGPLYGSFPKESEIKKNFKDILEVYLKAFGQFSQVLKKNGTVVISLPAYRQEKDRYVFMPTLDFIEKLGYIRQDPIPLETLEKYKFLKVTDRKTIIYDRKDQVVAREIVIIKLQ